jgi:pimeloyl-ACP methyl ester carboxylesterase
MTNNDRLGPLLLRRLASHLLGMAALCAAAASAQPSSGESSRELLTIDHYVRHRSTVPAIEGDLVQLYVRERVAAGMLARSSGFEDRVVLFVHGAGTPAEVAFDVTYEGYSWMAHIASAGYDVFSMDATGYGRSTRPAAMNDPCNLSAEQQQALIPHLLVEPCAPSHAGELTTIASDWDDIDAVVEYLRALRGVERVALVGWSLGGPRAGGYAARNPDKVSSIVLLAPAYFADMPSEPQTRTPSGNPPQPAASMTSQSHADFLTGWNGQIGCPEQYDPAAAEAIWSEMLASDPVGATWGPGVRRAPRTALWGFGRDVVAGMDTPMLLVAGMHDTAITPDRVRGLYDDLGSSRKILVELGCASHNAMWERVHGLLFDASLEWLERGTVNGIESGTLRLGFAAEE